MKSFFVLVLALVALTYAAPLLHADSQDAIEGSYIVVLKESLTILDKAVHILILKQSMLAAGANEQVTGEFGIDTFHGFHAEMSSTTLEQQLASPNVKYIEANQRVSLSYTVSEDQPVRGTNFVGGQQNDATWGLARISEHKLSGSKTYRYNDTADSIVDAYIIDTGILTAHEDFGGRATAAFNAIPGESGQDLNGHGTHVAGTVGGKVYGVHKTVNLFGVKVLNKSGSGTNAGVINGIDYVGNNLRKGKRSVANMSLGGSKSTALDDAVNAVAKKNVEFAVAAGNDNKDACNYSPAAAKDAITVGATTSTDDRSSFSNFGKCVDIFAPGTDITSDWIGSNSATKTISGTSMASPHVCGVLAKHREEFDTEALKLEAWLNEVSTPNVVKNPGTNSPNRLLYAPYV